MFDQMTERQLEQMADELEVISEETPDTAFNKYPLFAAHLSLLMKTELIRRRDAD